MTVKRRVLVLNCGSATIKFALFFYHRDKMEEVTRGTMSVSDDATTATKKVLAQIPEQPDIVAHRIVNGGARFVAPTLIDDDVFAELERLAELAPLHNPTAVAAIAACRSLGVPMVAVFDSAFHHTLPESAYHYALPRALVETHGLRRYGFHGISHQSVLERYTELTGNSRPTIVSLHLGSGASAAAIREGRCIDTSMGMTPLEGLLMGTRAGDLDPGVLLHLLRRGVAPDELDRILNRESGLLAIAGTSDLRELERRDDAAAKLALEMFTCRIVKYIGAYLAVLGGAEALIFTGGIGENAVHVRHRVLERLAWAGVVPDDISDPPVREGLLTAPGSRVQAWVIPTREELLIARSAFAALMQQGA